MRAAIWGGVFLALLGVQFAAYQRGKQGGFHQAAAQWQAEMLNANFAAAKAQAQANAQALAAEVKAQAETDNLRAALADLEAENATLEQSSGGHCGIDAAHIGLLNR